MNPSHELWMSDLPSFKMYMITLSKRGASALLCVGIDFQRGFHSNPIILNSIRKGERRGRINASCGNTNGW